MFDSSADLKSFHDTHVRLTNDQRAEMRRRRDANRDRIIAGLAELGKPGLTERINQGGYAMRTMIQPPEGDEESRYDIDMGVVFSPEDTLAPRTTKGWVRDAIARKAPGLKYQPEAKPKCVRVVYADGYQCDFPVFRRSEEWGFFVYEIAINDEWVASDPKAINIWFEEVVAALSPPSVNGHQLRRIVRMIKSFAKVHAKRRRVKFPAGLVVSALAVECYQPVPDRDDEALYWTLHTLRQRSQYLPVMANGVQVSDERDIDRIGRLVEEANTVVNALGAVHEGDATATDARKAWKQVFRHSFFDEPVKALEQKSVLSAPPVLSSVVAGLDPAEKARRAEAAVRSTQERSLGTQPWASED